MAGRPALSRRAPWTLIVAALGAPLLIGATFGLVERKGALLASWTSLAGLSVFFSLVYSGDYRHEATWLAFVIAMYWICWKSDGPVHKPHTNGRSFAPVRALGFTFFLVVIGVQATLGVAGLAFAALVGTPESRSRDFADLVSRRPELKDAILIGDPDYMLEPMHYYLPNRTYFVREQRYGKYVHFTRKARLDLTLSDILDEARAIRSSTARPVAIFCSPGVSAKWTPPGFTAKATYGPFPPPVFRSSDFGRRRRCWRNSQKPPATKAMTSTC